MRKVPGSAARPTDSRSCAARCPQRRHYRACRRSTQRESLKSCGLSSAYSTDAGLMSAPWTPIPRQDGPRGPTRGPLIPEELERMRADRETRQASS